MPLQIPSIDDRRYQDLLDEALARIPIHNPEWTNFNKSDPGVTLIELFAFLTESLLYRANQIPERNRRKFLSLLGVPLQPASSARGLVTVMNERGPLKTITLNGGVEARAGQVPFRTETGLDVLPIEAQVYYKRKLTNPDQKVVDYYKLLYASYTGQPFVEGTDLELYETVPLGGAGSEVVDLANTVGNSLWIALLVRVGDKPAENTDASREDLRRQVREELGGKTLNVGLVPFLDKVTKQLSARGPGDSAAAPSLVYEIPDMREGDLLPDLPQSRDPKYRALEANAPTDIVNGPGVVQITFPEASQLKMWSNLDPLEMGAGEFPPALEETNAQSRVITWLRVRSSNGISARFAWAGINTVFVTQRAHVANEVLPIGTGEPDQVVGLSRTPVVPESVRLTVTVNGETRQWEEIDDLLSAGPEVPSDDLRQPPGMLTARNPLVEVFTVNPESGEIKFGDGFRGKRPPVGAIMRASYDYGVGRAGNVGPGSINSSPALPAGLKVTNPVRTWNGADAETIDEGEKQITRYLQHRDRLVTAADFETIARRTPGVDLGRIEVLAAYNPELKPNPPGNAAGAVTLMVIPRFDLLQPNAPMPDRFFLDAMCRYLDPRRLVTTELFLRGPNYIAIWVSVGINVQAGFSIAQVREAVKQALLDFLSPLPKGPVNPAGWPLGKPVVDLELVAVASRVQGVQLVSGVKIALGALPVQSNIPMTGLDLPLVAGMSVVMGDPVEIDQVRGQMGGPADGTTGKKKIVPVPVVPETC